MKRPTPSCQVQAGPSAAVNLNPGGLDILAAIPYLFRPHPLHCRYALLGRPKLVTLAGCPASLSGDVSARVL